MMRWKGDAGIELQDFRCHAYDINTLGPSASGEAMPGDILTQQEVDRPWPTSSCRTPIASWSNGHF